MDTGRLLLTVTLFVCLIEPTLQVCFKARVKNGKVRIRRRGQMVIYRCRRGFTMHGSKIAVCRNDVWSHPPPKCIASGCPDIVPSPGLKFTPSFGSAKMSFTCDRNFDLQGPTEIFCDKVSWDKPPPICKAATSALSCDFEDNEICGWKQSTKDDFDWFRNSGQTQSGYTGPPYDHTYGMIKKGYYLYIETSSPRKTGDEADLLSPVYQPEQSDQCFDLWYHMLGKDDVGSVDIFVKPESVDLDLVNSSFHQVGNQGDKWFRAEITVPPLDEKFQIVIRGKRLEGYASDIAIDDVRLYNCSEEVTSTTEVISTTTTVATTTTEPATTATITIRTQPTTRTTPPRSATTTTRPEASTTVSITTKVNKVTTRRTTKTPVVTRTTKSAPKTTTKSKPTTRPPTTARYTTRTVTTEKTTLPNKTKRPRRTTKPTMATAKTRRPTRRPRTTRKPRVTKPPRTPRPTKTTEMTATKTGFTSYKNSTQRPTTTSLGTRGENKTTVYVATTSTTVSPNFSAVFIETTTSFSDNVTDFAGNYTEKPYLIKKAGTSKMNDLIPLAIGIGGGVFFVIIISIILVSIWAKKKKRREVEPYEELEPITKAMSKTSLNLNLVNDYNIMDNE